MALPFDPKQIVPSDERLMSRVVSQDAIVRLLIHKGVLTKEEFFEMVKVVNLEIESAKNLLKLA